MTHGAKTISYWFTIHELGGRNRIRIWPRTEDSGTFQVITPKERHLMEMIGDTFDEWVDDDEYLTE